MTKFLIHQRKDGIEKMANVMTGIKELGFKFNEEVNVQGDKLVEVDNNLENANENTKKGAQELSKFAEALKGKGVRTLICLGVLILVLLFLVYMIFM